MKTGRTIQEIGAEIMRQSQAKEDYLVNTNSIVMEDWDGKPMLHLRGGDGLDLIEPLEIQQTAHRQIGDYLGIPRKYYDRMMDSDVGLLSYNVNPLVPARAGTAHDPDDGRPSPRLFEQPLSPHRQSGHRQSDAADYRGDAGGAL